MKTKLASQITFRLPKTQKDRLEQIGEKERRDVAELTRIAVDALIASYTKNTGGPGLEDIRTTAEAA